MQTPCQSAANLYGLLIFLEPTDLAKQLPIASQGSLPTFRNANRITSLAHDISWSSVAAMLRRMRTGSVFAQLLI
jgi:hypothetical protein